MSDVLSRERDRARTPTRSQPITSDLPLTFLVCGECAVINPVQDVEALGGSGRQRCISCGAQVELSCPVLLHAQS
jgi:hypothetical protein